MGSTLTLASDILRTGYSDAIVEQLNNDVVLLKRIKKNTSAYNGKNYTIPVHVSRNEGIGSVAEGAALPAYGSQGYTSAIVPQAFSYCRIRLSGQVLQMVKTNKNAFVDGLESEMQGATNDTAMNQNRQCYGDGTGVLTVCGTTSNSTTVVVTSTAKLRIGQRIDVLVTADGTTSTGAAGRTVSSITSATQFVISGAAITTDNTFSVYAAKSRNAEPMGLAGIVATTDTVTNGLHGIAVANYPIWKSTVTAVGGALTTLAMQTMEDNIRKSGAGKATAIFTSFGVSRAYGELQASTRTFVNTGTLDGGIEGLLFNKKPIITDADCPAGYMYFLDEKHLLNLESRAWGWMNEDGDVLDRVTDYDAYEAVLARYGNMGTDARNAHGVLTGVTEA